MKRLILNLDEYEDLICQCIKEYLKDDDLDNDYLMIRFVFVFDALCGKIKLIDDLTDIPIAYIVFVRSDGLKMELTKLF